MPPPSKLSTEAFAGLVKQSGLIDGDLLKRTWKELKDRGTPFEDARQVADELVGRSLITRWQADKLLQGRHKGFFLGKYRLLSHLGSGGMSQVYLAEHVLMRRRVAIKVLPKARVNDSSYLERFHREAQAVAALDHRNIVRAYDVDQEDNIHFLVMEYVPGQSLHELVVKNGPVDWVCAAEYMRQSAEGLYHAHRIGMVHRDIKPGNLLLDEKGTVKVLDLGLARFFDDKEENSLTVKHDEKVLGTADYLSPEQALDSHTVDIRSDLYSLGCTLYFLLSGHPPFPDGTLAQRLMAHQTKQPRRIRDQRPDVPESLVAIVDVMMAKKAEDRYQTARDTAEALANWLIANGGSTWARMNPSVASSHQGYGTPIGAASGSNVFAGGAADPSLAQPASGNASTHSPLADITQPVAADMEGHPFAASADASSQGRADDVSGSPEIAALFSHLADEGSTKIARTGRGNAATQPDEPAPTITSPNLSDFETRRLEVPNLEIPNLDATVAAPQFASPMEELEAQLSGAGWPPTEPLTFEPPPEQTAPEFEATILSPQVEAAETTLRTPVEAAPVAQPRPAKPRAAAAPRVANPVAGQDPPVAKPVASLPVAMPAAAARKKPQVSRNVLIGGASVISVLLMVIAYLLFGRGEASDPKVSASGKKKGKTTQTANSKGSKAGGASPLPDHGIYTVGPSGKYKTIAAALAEIKKRPPNKSIKAIQTIKVAAGQTYAERIAIDQSYPIGIEIVADPETGPPPVLAPTGSDPIVVIHPTKDMVKNFHLEGFRLDATGKDVAVELSEWIPGTQLKRLEIAGFSKAGIHVDGVQTYTSERDKIVVDNVVFRNAAPAAVGMMFSKKAAPPSYVQIHQCRFLGPLDCGIQFDSDIVGIDISESIFYQTATGVKLLGADRTWQDLRFASNTFYENDRGIVFTNMPGPQTRELGFYSNLFVGSKAADAVVEKDFKLKEFLEMHNISSGGAAHNWTTRPPTEPPKPEELSYLFNSIGAEHSRTDVEFVSTDPTQADFLAPKATSALQKANAALPPKNKLGPQIGAVRPK